MAEVMAARGYKVQPLPRSPRHDVVQVFPTIPFFPTILIFLFIGNQYYFNRFLL